MTAVLLQANSFSQTIAQGIPKMKGRALIAFGNENPAYGISTQPSIAKRRGNETFGMRCEAAAQYAAVVYSTQFPYFEASAGGCEAAPGGVVEDFYATLAGQSSIFTNQIHVGFFGCGELNIIQRDNPSVNLEGLLLLSGNTLETETGYIQTAASGDISVTGLAMGRPDLVLFSYFGRTEFGEPPIEFGERGTFSLGAFDGTNQWATGAQSGSYIVGGPRLSRASQTAVVVDPTNIDISAVSLDADGFTVNYPATNHSVIVQWYAIKDPGGFFKCGMGVEGDTSINAGFAPDCVVFANSGTTALNSNQGGCSVGVGACDSLLRQWSGWGAGGGINLESSYWTPSAISMALHPGSGPSSNTAEAVVTSMGASPSLNWITGGGTGMLFGWVAMRPSDATGFDGCGFTPQIYRWVQ